MQSRRSFLHLSAGAALASTGLLHPQQLQAKITDKAGKSPVQVIIPKSYKPDTHSNYEKKLVQAMLDFLERNHGSRNLPIWGLPLQKIAMQRRLESIVAAITTAVKRHSAIYPIDPAWIVAQIYNESLFYEYALSSALAAGICQFIPGTARGYGLTCAGDKSEHGQPPYKLPHLVREGKNYYQLRREKSRYRTAARPVQKLDLAECLQILATGDDAAKRVQDVAKMQISYQQKLEEYDRARVDARKRYNQYIRANVEGKNVFTDEEYLMQFDARLTHKASVMAMVQMMAENLRARHGNILSAAAGYHAGLSRTSAESILKPYGRIPTINTTIEYVSKILVVHHSLHESLT